MRRARCFAPRVFGGVGVADIMKAADLTHGGFYGHFDSKDDLVAQASQRAMARAAENWGKSQPMRRTIPMRRCSSITCRRAIATIPATAAPSRRLASTRRVAASRCTTPSPKGLNR